MMYLKGCPKCHGDLFTERLWPNDSTCLQCGWAGRVVELKSVPLVNQG